MPTQQRARGGAEDLKLEAGISKEKSTLSSNALTNAKSRRNVLPHGSKTTVVSSFEADLASSAPDGQNGVGKIPLCVLHSATDSAGISHID